MSISFGFLVYKEDNSNCIIVLHRNMRMQGSEQIIYLDDEATENSEMIDRVKGKDSVSNSKTARNEQG